MPGQRQKGKKNVKRTSKNKFELVLPEEGSFIASVIATHGGRPPRFTCKTINGDEINAPLQGSIARGPKRTLVKKGFFVLLVPHEDTKITGTNTSKLAETTYYINHVYTDDDIRELQKKGFFTKPEKAEDADEDTIVFVKSTTEDVSNTGEGVGDLEDIFDIDDI